jgi:RimJ/RimL family protein N-acetyltransferase
VLFAIAPEFGITVIKSSYDVENDKVKNFYKKFGFSEIGRMPYTRNVKGKLHDEALVVKKL